MLSLNILFNLLDRIRKLAVYMPEPYIHKYIHSYIHTYIHVHNTNYISSNPGGVSPFTKDYYKYYVPICLSMRLNKKVLKNKKCT